MHQARLRFKATFAAPPEPTFLLQLVKLVLVLPVKFYLPLHLHSDQALHHRTPKYLDS